jgi:RNA polymerase sigma-70 factor (ECF subfamily)
MIQIKESSYELYKALGAIKDSYREVIILRKIKEFSIEETAEVLGWSESKVKSTLYRAIPVLETQLLKEGYLHEGTIYKKFIGY